MRRIYSHFIKRILPVVLISTAGISHAHQKTPDWVKTAVFYDIYPSSFMDSDGNGIGDIPGIISRLDYVKSLGANAIWMNPIFESGWFDGGYDIIDFYKVDPRFGTNEDVRRLVDEAHKRGIKVCLDLVPGHSSNKCDWFRKSATEGPDGRYADYYIWCDSISAKDLANIEKRHKEADPISSTTGAWVEIADPYIGDARITDANRGKYYLKNYYACQPALNYGYANPDPKKPWQQPVNAPGPQAMRRELKNIMSFWYDKGIDGFRVDMAKSLIKNDKGYKETMKLWEEMRQWQDANYPGKILISEWGSPDKAIPAGFDIDFYLPWARKPYAAMIWETGKNKIIGPGAYFEKSGKGKIRDFVEIFNSDLKASQPYGFIAIPSSNHDYPRVNAGTRNKPEESRVFMTFLLTMPGVPFIHYGDEIGMRSVENLPSVEGSLPERSCTRTPMQWENEPSAGFSTAAPEKLYLPVYLDDGRLTVAEQEKDAGSNLNFNRNLICLRHEFPALGNGGDWKVVSDIDTPYPMVYTRSDGKNTFIVALNPRSESAKTEIILPGAVHLTELSAVGKTKARVKNGKIALDMGGISARIFKVE